MAPSTEENSSEGSSGNAVSAKTVRVFVALKITSDVAEELTKIARPLERFAVRPITKEDIHLTLVPPWNEPSVPSAVEKLRTVVGDHFPFMLHFRHVGYGPDPRRPRFLWAECSASKELTDLHAGLLRAFGQSDGRPFRPHVTLARIRANAAKICRKCPIDRDLAVTQQIETVELMQSPPPKEHGYRVLASPVLKQCFPSGRSPVCRV